MAKAIAARRKGDDYQARVFWLYLLQLRTGDCVDSVALESDGVSFVDDVVVTYGRPVRDPVTGWAIVCDFQQCKYHVAGNGSFTCESLIDPAFINSQESMLKRLHAAYCKLKLRFEGARFLLTVVSSWNWHPDNPLSAHIGEKAIRLSFYEGGPASATGKIRAQFAAHLGISETELKEFLDTVRFRLGRDLDDLRREMEPLVELAGLVPCDPAHTGCVYDDLAWKLFGQGRNRFDRESFEALIREEGLIAPQPTGYSEISICSRPEFARRPSDLQAARLDLCDLFDGRLARASSAWLKEVPERAAAFLGGEELRSLPPPIHAFFDCHLSIAFLVGHLMNPKYSIRVVPAHKTRQTGYEFWSEPSAVLPGPLWTVDRSGGEIGEECVLGISVTNPIGQHLRSFLEAAKLDGLPLIHCTPVSGIGPRAVTDGQQAWSLGYELQRLLRELLPTRCRKMHVFFSGPAALAFILGNTLRHSVLSTQLYEHDFEGGASEVRYFPSICLSAAKV